MQPDLDRMVEFIRSQLDADEQWALACNRPYEYADEGAKAPETGVRWQWVTGDNWDPVTPDPVTMEVVEGPDDEFRVNLATVEEWPSTTYGDTMMMARTYAGTIEEMDPAGAGHIIRHDPARVLRRVAADRATLELCVEANGGAELGVGVSPEQWLAQTVLRNLASGYDDRDGYDESWRPA